MPKAVRKALRGMKTRRAKEKRSPGLPTGSVVVWVPSPAEWVSGMQLFALYTYVYIKIDSFIWMMEIKKKKSEIDCLIYILCHLKLYIGLYDGSVFFLFNELLNLFSSSRLFIKINRRKGFKNPSTPRTNSSPATNHFTGSKWSKKALNKKFKSVPCPYLFLTLLLLLLFIIVVFLFNMNKNVHFM